MKTISDHALKSRMSEYFRELEATGEELHVTHEGQLVLKIISYRREMAGNDASTQENTNNR